MGPFGALLYLEVEDVVPEVQFSVDHEVEVLAYSGRVRVDERLVLGRGCIGCIFGFPSQ